eukprot:TRINITY_DN21918_c0_g1_i1.p1 TRINITY_DN21918_c0_g1~~TRINITY_DN21918_c0_g1_i1.p1  ORF type:complete len:378 (-),score=40.04 TRINITY_DN21918_c0_g1_i1:833-1966(-)
MIKAKTLKDSYSWIANEDNEKKPPHSIGTAIRHSNAKESDSLLTGAIDRRKLRNIAEHRVLIEDIHHVLATFVGHVRGQCGIIQSAEVLAIKQFNKTKRQSHLKSEIAVFSVRNCHPQEEESLPDSAISLKEVEVFQNFINNLGTLLYQRGLVLQNVLPEGLKISQDLKLWLSDLILQSYFEVDANAEDEDGTKQYRTQKGNEAYIQTLIRKDHFAEKWLKGITDLTSKYPNTQSNMLSYEGYQTRQKWFYQTSVHKRMMERLDAIMLRHVHELIQNKGIFTEGDTKSIEITFATDIFLQDFISWKAPGEIPSREYCLMKPPYNYIRDEAYDSGLTSIRLLLRKKSKTLSDLSINIGWILKLHYFLAFTAKMPSLPK